MEQALSSRSPSKLHLIQFQFGSEDERPSQSVAQSRSDAAASERRVRPDARNAARHVLRVQRAGERIAVLGGGEETVGARQRFGDQAAQDLWGAEKLLRWWSCDVEAKGPNYITLSLSQVDFLDVVLGLHFDTRWKPIFETYANYVQYLEHSENF